MRLFLHPISLAAVLTLLNAAKPPVVDDTAYLLFAKQIAQKPLDPYGYDLFWYEAPEPAFGILATPVVPYWLAPGVNLVGDDWFLLKLWLFPFALILAFAVRSLGRRFAPDAGPCFTAAVVLGPGVLPFFNVMLDVPALALELAAVAVFLRGTWRDVVFAGWIAGLAMQTKYTAFLTPVAFVLCGLSRRASGGSRTCATSRDGDGDNENGIRSPLTLTLSPEAGERGLGSVVLEVWKAVVATAVALFLFAEWEFLLFRQYGESHFLNHAAAKHGRLDQKTAFILPLLGQFGAAAGWAGYAGWAALRFPGTRWFAGLAVLLLVGLCAVPLSFGELRFGSVTANAILFTAIGGSALLAAVACGRPWDRDGLFLLAWLAAEAAGAVVLSPFPAGRRVLVMAFVAVLLIARRSGVGFRGWAVVGVVCGMVLAALDTAEAWVEPVAAAQAAKLIPAGSPTYFVGHWGFQDACERRGWTPLVPGKELSPGDTLVLPLPPVPGESFYRPLVMSFITPPPDGAANLVATIIVDDAVPITTLPNLYTGGVPLGRRKGPRMVVAVYRVLGPWRPIANR